MVRLTDQELAVLMRAAAPLPPGRRNLFLQAIAAALSRFHDIDAAAFEYVVADVLRQVS